MATGHPAREFAAGFATLLRGFALWRVRPGLLALGLIPAALAAVLLIAALIPVGVFLPSLAAFLTPFAEDWPAPWPAVLRIVIALALLVAAAALATTVFTALTLTIGDPFYQRIWRGVERYLGGPEPRGGAGLGVVLGEGIRLVLAGVGVALISLLLGLVPLVGGLLAPVIGGGLNARLLARELTGRAFDARGLASAERSRLLGSHRARVLGFGVATQLCFLVPLGAIIVMPAAVAGSTLLARWMTDAASPAEGTTDA